MPLRPVHCWARSRVSPISAGLRRGVRRLGEPGGGEAQHRGDVDDRGAGLHHATARLRHPVAAVEVDVDDLSGTARGVSRVAGTAVPMPALLTSTSTRPNASIAASTSAWHASGRATSVCDLHGPPARGLDQRGGVVEPRRPVGRRARRRRRPGRTPRRRRRRGRRRPRSRRRPCRRGENRSRDRCSSWARSCADRRRAQSVAACGPARRERDHVVEGVAHLPVEVAGGGLAGGDDAGGVAGAAGAASRG